MKYYIILNGRQAGPFEENQLLSMGVTRSTMVWREGMQNWQEAGQLAELAYLFNNNDITVEISKEDKLNRQGGDNIQTITLLTVQMSRQCQRHGLWNRYLQPCYAVFLSESWA